MEVIDLIFKILTLSINLFRAIYTVYQDKKKAATGANSDGDATK